MNKLLFLALAVAVSGVPVVPNVHGQIDATLAFAVDLNRDYNATIFQCLWNAGNRVVFLRGYNSDGQGSVDPYSLYNIPIAYNLGIGTEVYMSPALASNKTGATQFNELYKYLTANAINIRFIWLQVTSPIDWSSDRVADKNFIDSVRAAATAKGVGLGFYTSQYDWKQITNDSTDYSKKGDKLWYWRNNGDGTNGATPANYYDYYSFGGWTLPVVKQYSQNVNVCGVYLNKDVYSTTPSTAMLQKMDGPVVGGNFM